MTIGIRIGIGDLGKCVSLGDCVYISIYMYVMCTQTLKLMPAVPSNIDQELRIARLGNLENTKILRSRCSLFCQALLRRSAVVLFVEPTEYLLKYLHSL